MTNVCYLPGANRRCADCDRTKAVPETVARRLLAHALTVIAPCERCGDAIEIDARPLTARPHHHLNPNYVPRCDNCCSECDLASCEVTLPDNLGLGFVYLCAECVARYDESGTAWKG